MPARPSTPPTEPVDTDHDGPALRRAPFSDNPEVGARGLRTQQRILDAALEVFGTESYERATIDQIAQVAGCSRVSVYQYFAGKDDLFRHLAGQVARQLRASTEALEPITPDTAGWTALRGWVGRYAAIYARYEPVFRAFSAAAETDEALAGGSVRTGERNLALFESKISSSALSSRELAAATTLLVAGVTRTFATASILGSAAPDAWPGERVENALADVVHRSLFSVQPGINTHVSDAPSPPRLRIGDALGVVFARVGALEAEATQPGRRALASLLEVGEEVVVGRGFQGTRVDDLVTAAGVSHGAFYRYFENKDDLVRVAAARALRDLSTALGEIPRNDRTELRRWLKRYHRAHSAKGAMIRVWVEAADDPLHADRAAVFDWGRRRVLHLLADRDLGDRDGDSLVLFAVIEAFGTRPYSAASLDAALHVLTT